MVYYTVSFETNGGSRVPSQKVTKGRYVMQPANPTYYDYVFIGWYLDESLTTKFNFYTAINGDIKLYAKFWSPRNFVYVKGTSVNEYVSNSYIFKSSRNVVIRPIYICIHEVTQQEYETYCTYNCEEQTPDNEEPFGFGKGPNYPAYYISWYNTLIYCNKRSIAEGLTPCYSIQGKTDPADWGELYKGSPRSADTAKWDDVKCDFDANGYRLPTEAEWEYAARSENKENYTYAGSDVIDDVAWCRKKYTGDAHKVCTKKPNGLRIYDMSGNVAEWCWDWYEHVIQPSTGGTGPATGTMRVLRGGDFDCKYSCTVYERYGLSMHSNYNHGFRVVRTAK